MAAGCLVSARLAGPGLDRRLRVVLDGSGLVVVAYLAAVMLDGPALTLAWAAEAAVLAGLARHHRDADARAGALGFLCLAPLHAVVVVAPLDALVSGVDDPLGALALLAVAGGTALGELGVRQQGQALLSGLWALAGVGALVAGLLRDRRQLRLGALALLAVTLAKVGLYDLASLDSMYRVASFLAFEALLLLGAFAWQRLRPAAPRDLRDVPPAIR